MAKFFKSVMKKFTYLTRNTSFFMQGQMDIHPLGRWHNKDFVAKTGGFFIKDDPTHRRIANLEPWDNTRRDMITLLMRTLVKQQIEGDLAELGVYKGNTAKLIHHYLPERKLFLFDTFEGFTERSVQAERKNTQFETKAKKFSDTSLEGVQAYIAPQNDNVVFCPGYFPDSIPDDFADRRFAMVHLDADLYEPILAGLEFFYPRMVERGIILVHDYNAWLGARTAVDDFFSDKPELVIPMPDKSGSALIIKQVQLDASIPTTKTE